MGKHWPSDRIGRESMKKCKWEEDQLEGGWDGSCAIRWWLDAGTPESNGMIFCQRCGKRIGQEAAK